MVIKTNDIEGPMGDRWTISTENNVGHVLGEATHALGSVLCEMEIWLIWSSQAARQGTTVSLFCLTVLYSPSCPNTSFMHRSERPCGQWAVG